MSFIYFKLENLPENSCKSSSRNNFLKYTLLNKASQSKKYNLFNKGSEESVTLKDLFL